MHVLTTAQRQVTHGTWPVFRLHHTFFAKIISNAPRLIEFRKTNKARGLQHAQASSFPVPYIGEVRRLQTAAQILKILSQGQYLEEITGRRFEDCIHLLPAVVEAPKAWNSLESSIAQGKSRMSHALVPRWHRVPPLPATPGFKCCLAGSSRGRRFINREVNLFISRIFECLPEAVQLAGLPQVSLNCFDLHHAHIFLSHEENKLGFLFHSKEYPAFDPHMFPVNLGNCQRCSTLRYDERAMDFRNMLWYDGILCSLDVGESSVLHDYLLMDGLQGVNTVLEADFGMPLADVLYMSELKSRKPSHRVMAAKSLLRLSKTQKGN